jgi:hypothetical protein
MSNTISGKKRYTATFFATGPHDEQRTFEHDFCSANPEKYLERYRKRLIEYGWYTVKFVNLIER